MTDIWPYGIVGLLAVSLVILLTVRERVVKKGMAGVSIGSAQARGRRESQADACSVSASRSGYLMIVADGMGAESFHVKISEIVCRVIEEQYSYYGSNMNTALFFKSAMALANKRVLNYLGGDRGGVSLTVALLIGSKLHFSHAGNTRLAVLRNGELISLYKGHTMREFAEKSYMTGTIGRDEALAHLYDQRVYRYIGHEEFDFEGEEMPVALKPGDIVALMTDGVFDSLGWRNICELLSESGNGRTLADKVIAACERVSCDDNASIVVAKI
jgi:serine/threonine protein phosphatase PrpC